MHATIKHYRQAPRKVRLVTDLVKGKKVSLALTHLEFLSKKASDQIAKVIKSAAANAKQQNASLTDDDLIIKNITVDKGMTFKRFMPRARGRATPLHKETSHVKVTLLDISGTPKQVVEEKDTDKK